MLKRAVFTQRVEMLDGRIFQSGDGGNVSRDQNGVPLDNVALLYRGERYIVPLCVVNIVDSID
jgi:hypothetical protein